MLSYVLERRPDEFGLVPAEDGSVKIKDLLKVMGEEAGWKWVRMSSINDVLYALTDPPFEIIDDTIRARNRDRLPVTAPVDNPPKLLFVCIRRRAHPRVQDKGIFPGATPSIILSSDPAMAERMGRRLEQSPVLLTVNVDSAMTRGVIFHQAGEALYLADSIPKGCFTGPPLPKIPTEPEKQKPKQHTQPAPSPGTFQMDISEEKSKKDRLRRKKQKDISRNKDRERKRRNRQKIW